MNRIKETALEPEFRPERAGDVRHSLASLERIGSVLGYSPAVTLEAGLRATLDWAATEESGE